MAIGIPDPFHSQDEERFVLLGHSSRNRRLVVVHTVVGDSVGDQRKAGNTESEH